MIVIFGGGGALGSAIKKEANNRGIASQRLSHAACDISLDDDVEGVARLPADVWINCAGALRADQYGYKPVSNIEMIRVNALGPHVLAKYARYAGAHLIHISTDSVFSGNEFGRRDIKDRPDPSDLYGATKRVGEELSWWAPNPSITVLRTSFVSARSGLLKMLMDQPIRSTVFGHANSWWSGSTVQAVAEAILTLAENPPGGLHHLATRDVISKAHLLAVASVAFNHEIAIERRDSPIVYRGLVPTIELEDFDSAIIKYASEVKKEGL